MTTFYFAPSECEFHDPGPGHPERSERFTAIQKIVDDASLPSLEKRTSQHATKQDLRLAHSQNHIDYIFDHIPAESKYHTLIEARDTTLSASSGDAALHATGAVLEAIKTVLENKGSNAFCTVRPPGHHAHRNFTGGFCLFNNIAIGAYAALQRHGLKRVAILDFDVHHGNGTDDIIGNNPDIFLASTYEYPQYAATHETQFETGIDNNVLNIPFPPGTRGREIVETWQSRILPKVREFKPEMIFVSAGFDGHSDDPLGDWFMDERDYAEIMQLIKDLADQTCEGKLVAVLEGGYNLEALANSVLACLIVMGK